MSISALRADNRIVGEFGGREMAKNGVMLNWYTRVVIGRQIVKIITWPDFLLYSIICTCCTHLHDLYEFTSVMH